MIGSLIRGVSLAGDKMIMRQLRIRELQAARDKLGDAFIIALIVFALFWSYQLRQRVDERDYLIRTIAFEASDETEVGKVAVAYVVLNRKKSGRWGDNIQAVVTHPGQFEPWMTRRRDIETLSSNDPRYQSAAIIADAVLSGRTPDPTAGATHFLNPTIVRERRGGSLPSWALGEGRPIGRHIFYSPDEGSLISSAMVDPPERLTP
jgi:spore germination cell wall hydrolase CwlJ-like protein